MYPIGGKGEVLAMMENNKDNGNKAVENERPKTQSESKKAM